MQAINLLVSDANGIYVPQVFATNYDLSLWSNIDPEDLTTIEEGPDHEYYWEAWNNILNSATYLLGGDQYHLHNDGDLWAICYDKVSDEEYEEFFGEARER